MWQDIRGDKIIFYEFRNKGYDVGAKVKQANRRHITAEGHKKTIKCWRIRGLLSFHDIIRVVPTTFLLYFFYIVASSFFIYNRVFFMCLGVWRCTYTQTVNYGVFPIFFEALQILYSIIYALFVKKKTVNCYK